MQESQHFTRTSVFDFVRIEGLQKLTSVTAHDWDLYIVKELVDNALDADEAITGDEDQPGTQHPRISVEMHYGSDGPDHWLEIIVRNRAPFPLG
ncbi:ATP-binding protein, partial [bacterium]|nr:ATP-binding protein [bacterium]